jgi:hypothetical protein
MDKLTQADSSGNTADLYSGDIQFEFELGYKLI